jgi:phosphate transport system substrate-binding protein
MFIQALLAAAIAVGGTTNLAPLVTKAATSYQNAHNGVAVDVKGSSSGEGIAALKNRTVQVAMSDVAVNDAAFSDTILGVVGFAFIVSPDAGIKNLTREEVQDIYSGKVTNWKQLGGNDVKIVPMGREIGTGTRFVLEDKVAKTLIPIQVEANATMLADAVAKTPGAIGYAASGFIGSHQDLVVTYEGVAPTEENIRSHAYPFATDEHLYALKDADATVRAFIDYVKGDTALLRDNGVF